MTLKWFIYCVIGDSFVWIPDTAVHKSLALAVWYKHRQGLGSLSQNLSNAYRPIPLPLVFFTLSSFCIEPNSWNGVPLKLPWHAL